MYVGKDWPRAIRHAQANANASGRPWVVWFYCADVHITAASDADMDGSSVRVKDGGLVVDPEREKD